MTELEIKDALEKRLEKFEGLPNSPELRSELQEVITQFCIEYEISAHVNMLLGWMDALNN